MTSQAAAQTTTSTAASPTAEHVKEYIQSAFFTPEDSATLGFDDDLLELLDSLQVLRMITDLESKYGVKFQNSEMTPENLGSIRKLAAFVDKKR